MSEKVGPWGLNVPDQEVFLGKDITRNANMSSETSALVDEEVKVLLDTAYNTAVQILKDNAAALEKISSLLLEDETISGAQMNDILESFGSTSSVGKSASEDAFKSLSEKHAAELAHTRRSDSDSEGAEIPAEEGEVGAKPMGEVENPKDEQNLS